MWASLCCTARQSGECYHQLKDPGRSKDAKKAYEKALKELGKKKVNLNKSSKELEKA